MEFTIDLRLYIVIMVIVGTCIGALNTAFRSLVLDADPATRWLADLTGSKLPDLPPTPEPPAIEQSDAVKDPSLG